MVNILVVEDDIPTRTKLELHLRKEWFDVSSTGWFGQAIELINSELVDVLITDTQIFVNDAEWIIAETWWTIDSMWWLKVAEFFRDLFPDKLIIATSTEYKDFREWKCDIFIKKPIDLNRLIEIIWKAVQG